MTKEQEIFYLGYMPNDKHFTTIEEINIVNALFGLDKMSREELQELRNEIVLFHNDDIDKHETDMEYCYDRMTALMSITAIIDNFKYRY